MDTSGRFIICDVKIEERCITLPTLYAPIDDELSINSFTCTRLSLRRLNNLVLDLDKDKKGG